MLLNSNILNEYANAYNKSFQLNETRDRLICLEMSETAAVCMAGDISANLPTFNVHASQQNDGTWAVECWHFEESK